MKKLIFILLTGIILTSCTGNKDRYTLKGAIKGIDTGMVFLQKFNADNWQKIDSVKLDKGKFTFKGKLGLPEMWFIAMPDKQVFVPVFMENGKIDVEIYPDSADKSKIKGSASQDIYQQFVTLSEEVSRKMEVVYREWKNARDANDSATMKRTDSISGTLDKELKQKLIDFAKANGKSVVAPYIIMRNSWQFELPDLEAIVVNFDTALNASTYTQAIKKRIGILQSVAIGKQAPDFTMNDSIGNPVALSSLKGKIVLIDFWTSWCSPCRAENPNVVKAYQSYHKKGFDILGCSFDQNRDKWLKAIRDDKLAWGHVSDLKGWGNAAGKLYGVNSIPANVLLDKDQKIIARNLRGEELQKKLSELLGPMAPEKKSGKKKK
ncbi:MAG: AhpC/TSA family protein [Bacteroidales bacterium]|nr:AhpC/TSA family protein [Bacteroidales bacterium]